MFGILFFPDRRRGFRELFRVLRPGGQVLVSSWAPIARSSAMQLLFAALRAADPNVRPPEADPTSLENPEVFERELREAGYRDVCVEEVEHTLEVHSADDFWHEMVRGSAPMALLRRKLGEAEWTRQEEIARGYLREHLTELPARLGSTAYLAVGTR